jgi:hypothetical protein
MSFVTTAVRQIATTEQTSAATERDFLHLFTGFLSVHCAVETETLQQRTLVEANRRSIRYRCPLCFCLCSLYSVIVKEAPIVERKHLALVRHFIISAMRLAVLQG